MNVIKGLFSHPTGLFSSLSFTFSHQVNLDTALILSFFIPSSLFIPQHHCPASSSYLILLADSLQPLALLFLKEKELKLAGEMNNATAINSGMKVFLCVWGGCKDLQEVRWWWGKGGLWSWSVCFFLTFAQTSEEGVIPA